MEKAGVVMDKPVYKVGIIGSGGTGKTSLGRELAALLGVQFLPSKEITRGILDRLNYQWDGDVYVERFLAQRGCENEILDKTLEREATYDSFVTDQTCISVAAYTLLEAHQYTDTVEEIVGICQECARTYTHLVLCPWGFVPLESNDVRTLNPWYQFTVHNIILGLLHEWDLDFYRIGSFGEQRIVDVKERFFSHL